MFKLIKFFIPLALLLFTNIYSKELNEIKRLKTGKNNRARLIDNNWSEVDWWALWGDFDDIETFYKLDKVKSFNGVENSGWDMTFWYDSALGIKGEEISIIVNDNENTITLYSQEFNEQGDVIEVIDSLTLQYDSDGLLTGLIDPEVEKKEYFVNPASLLMDSMIFYDYDESTSDWKKSNKKNITYKGKEILTYKSYDWNEKLSSWEEEFSERWIYNSEGILDSIIEDYGSLYISVYSYSEDNKSDTCLEYKKTLDPDNVLLMYKSITTKDSNGRDSAWTFYLYDGDLDSFYADDQTIYTYTDNGDIKEAINVEYVDSVKQFIPTWKEVFIYDNKNKPLGFQEWVYENGVWYNEEDVFTVTFRESTPISSKSLNSISGISDFRVIQSAQKCELSFHVEKNKPNKLKLYDMQGRLIKTLMPEKIGSRVSFSFDKDLLSKGRVYLLRLNVDGKYFTNTLLLK